MIKIIIKALLVLIILNSCFFLANAKTISNTESINNISDLQETYTDTKYQLLSAQEEITKLQQMNYDLRRILSEKEAEIRTIKENFQIQREKEDFNEPNDQKSLNEVYKQKLNELSLQIKSINNELYRVKTENLSYTKNREELSNLNLSQKNKINELEKKLEINTVNYSQNASLASFLMKNKDESALFFYNLGKRSYENRDYQCSKEYFTAATQIKPDFYPSYRELGLILAEEKNYNASIQSFNEYLKYTNNSKEAEIVRNFIKKLKN